MVVVLMSMILARIDALDDDFLGVLELGDGGEASWLGDKLAVL